MSGYGLFIALLLLIAAIVAGLTLLLRRRAILQASRAQNAQLKMLSEAVHAIASASHLDADAVCRLVYENVINVVKADMFQIGLFDGDHYDIRVRIEGGRELPPARYTMDRGGIVKWLRDNA